MEKIAVQHCVYLNTLKNWLEKLIMDEIYTGTITDYQNLIQNKTVVKFETRNDAFDDDEF